MRISLLIAIIALWLAGCRSTPNVGVELPKASQLQSHDPDWQDLTVRPVVYDEPTDVEEPIPAPPGDLEGNSAAQLQDEVLTLNALEQMALSTNPSVARAAAILAAARGNWRQVGLPPNPTIGYEAQQLGSDGLAEQYGVFIGQEIIRGGKLRLNREVAAREVFRAEQELLAQQQRVITDVRVAFYEVLVAQREEQFSRELQGIAAQGATTAEALARGEQVGEVDVIQAELERENADILVQNARNRVRAAWQSLAAVSGDPGLVPRRVDGDLEQESEVLDWDVALEQLQSSSPEIGAAWAELERARWALDRARAENAPDVTVQGLVNWRDNGIGGQPDGAVSVGIPLPLWNRNQGRIMQAAQEAAAAERAIEQLELSLQNRLAPVFERYSNARSQVKRYRTTILPAAERSLELTRTIYEAGQESFLDVLTAQRTYAQANLNYLESLRQLRTAEAEIEGLLLSGSLERR